MPESALLLSTAALARMSSSTRDEIRSYFFGPAAENTAPSTDTSLNDESDWETTADDLTPLGGNQITKFMRSVSEQSRDLLRAFAATTDGVLTMKEVRRVGQYDTWQQTRGFTSGLTRRVRTITGDNEADFYGWRGAENPDDGAFFVHPTTHQSLRRFFGL